MTTATTTKATPDPRVVAAICEAFGFDAATASRIVRDAGTELDDVDAWIACEHAAEASEAVKNPRGLLRKVMATYKHPSLARFAWFNPPKADASDVPLTARQRLLGELDAAGEEHGPAQFELDGVDWRLGRQGLMPLKPGGESRLYVTMEDDELERVLDTVRDLPPPTRMTYSEYLALRGAGMGEAPTDGALALVSAASIERRIPHE